MNIHWFPGHMTKSLRMMDENVKLMDMLVYVLDSRAPASCINPVFNKYTEKLPVVYVLNKADLGDKTELDAWKKKLSGPKSVVITLNSTMTGSGKAIFPLAKQLCAEKIERLKAKGVRAVLRAMVIGVPNCGKSTLINNLCGKAKATTGNKAGVTRGKQWVKVAEYLEILDTPGTLYPKFDNEKFAKHLAYVGSIKDEIVDSYELCLEFIKEITLLDKSILENRYKIECSIDSIETLGRIAAARGLMLRGGTPDEERAATAVIDDFRKGRLGKITLDKADD